jgi:hypothetical protein
VEGNHQYIISHDPASIDQATLITAIAKAGNEMVANFDSTAVRQFKVYPEDWDFFYGQKNG